MQFCSARVPALTGLPLGLMLTQFGTHASGQPYTQDWILQVGTSKNESIQCLAADNAMGVIVAGYTDGKLGIAQAGANDIWIARFDALGSQSWLRQFGTTADDTPRAILNVGAHMYLGGGTGGALQGANAGGSDCWLAQLDLSGTELWIRQFGTSATDTVTALASDGGGGVFVGGQTSGKLGATHFGSSDSFLALYSSAGSLKWIQQFGNAYAEALTSLSDDGAGGVYACGWNYSASTLFTSPWLSKYNSAGTLIWSTSFGFLTYGEAFSVGSDSAHNVYVLVELGLTPPQVELHKYSPAGNYIWSKSVPHDAAPCDGAAVSVTDSVVLIAGWSEGAVYGPNSGKSDIWLAAFDHDGNALWNEQLGSAGIDAPRCLAVDTAGFYVGGGTNGVLGSSGFGKYDGWLARYESTSCYADCDESGTLDLFDFLCFVNEFNSGNPFADCDGSGSLDLFDFLCFVNAFNAGCP